MNISHETGLAKVYILGLGIQSHPGVASRYLDILSEGDIPIKMISTSEIKLSCLVPEASSEKSTDLLHKAFIEGKKEA